MSRSDSSDAEALKVLLPSNLSDFFQSAEFLGIIPNDARNTERLRIRCRAAITIENVSPERTGCERHGEVLLKDISQSGIAFLYHEAIDLEDIVFVRFRARQIRAKVIRCRKLSDSCFECGARMISFISLESANWSTISDHAILPEEYDADEED